MKNKEKNQAHEELTDGWIIGQKIGHVESRIYKVLQSHPHTILPIIPPPPGQNHTILMQMEGEGC